METLNELITAHFNPDPDITARAVFDAAGVPQKWRELFYRVVRDECRRSARTIVRLHERGIDADADEFSPLATTTTTTPNERPSPGVTIRNGETTAVVYLADRMYCGPDHQWVLKGAATAQQWESRAAYLDAQARGIAETRNDCIAVAKYLRDAGADCLNDLEQVAA
jgi:hypothetical protein